MYVFQFVFNPIIISTAGQHRSHVLLLLLFYLPAPLFVMSYVGYGHGVYLCLFTWCLCSSQMKIEFQASERNEPCSLCENEESHRNTPSFELPRFFSLFRFILLSRSIFSARSHSLNLFARRKLNEPEVE